MQTRIGEEKDFKLLDELLKEAANRLKEKGSKQWSHVLENEEEVNLLSHLIHKEVLVFEVNNELVGMCYLYTEPNNWDFGLWKQAEKQGHYYLHKVVIGDRFVGKNYGQQIMKEVLAWVRNKQGQKVLLDCKADVLYLNNFYQKIGFEFVSQSKAGSFDGLFADFNLYEYRLQQ